MYALCSTILQNRARFLSILSTLFHNSLEYVGVCGIFWNIQGRVHVISEWSTLGILERWQSPTTKSSSYFVQDKKKRALILEKLFDSMKFSSNERLLCLLVQRQFLHHHREDEQFHWFKKNCIDSRNLFLWVVVRCPRDLLPTPSRDFGFACDDGISVT